MRNGIKVLIAALTISFATAFILFGALRDGSLYYMEVADLANIDQSESLQKNVRVSGNIQKGSSFVNDNLLTFVMDDDSGAEIQVAFSGVVPDAFEEGQQAIVEGVFNAADGTFDAKNLMVKCPSKYDVEE